MDDFVIHSDNNEYEFDSLAAVGERRQPQMSLIGSKAVYDFMMFFNPVQFTKGHLFSRLLPT